MAAQSFFYVGASPKPDFSGKKIAWFKVSQRSIGLTAPYTKLRSLV